MWVCGKRFIAVIGFLLFSMQGAFAVERLSVFARFSTDWLYHGLSETSGNPSLGINAELQLTSYLLAGVSFNEGNVNSTARQRHRSTSPYIGLEFALNEKWFAGTYFQARRFMGSAREWDFEEFSVLLSHQNGFSARLDYSPDYYSSNASSFNVLTEYQAPINDLFYFAAGLGHFDLDDELDYQYAHVKLGARYKRYSANIGYYWVSDSVFPSPVGRIETPGLLFEVICKCF